MTRRSRPVDEATVEDWHVVQQRHRRALALAENCGQCSGRLEPHEPCYRVRTLWGFDGEVAVRRLALLCGDCVSSHWLAQEPTPCEACGRPVVEGWGWHLERKHVFCSERCQRRAANQRRDAHFAAGRHKVCAGCDAAFDANRRHACWCLPTCLHQA